jgi:hypothetical protein
MRCLMLILMLSIFPAYAYAGKVVAIVVTDTFDGSIGTGIKANQKQISALLDRLEVEGHFEVSRTVIEGAAFSCNAISDAVSQITINSDDAVIFYYAGHGYRLAKSGTKFPYFECASADGGAAKIGLADVVAKLTGKNPRFILAVADTCNVVIAEPAPGVAGGTIGAASKRRAGFQNLFDSYSGTLTLSGSVPGDPSWYSNGASPGGFFTSQFLSMINQEVSNEGASAKWKAIAEASVKPIFIPKSGGEKLYQHPQYDDSGLKGKE